MERQMERDGETLIGDVMLRAEALLELEKGAEHSAKEDELRLRRRSTAERPEDRAVARARSGADAHVVFAVRLENPRAEQRQRFQSSHPLPHSQRILGDLRLEVLTVDAAFER